MSRNSLIARLDQKLSLMRREHYRRHSTIQFTVPKLATVPTLGSKRYQVIGTEAHPSRLQQLHLENLDDPPRIVCNLELQHLSPRGAVLNEFHFVRDPLRHVTGVTGTTLLWWNCNPSVIVFRIPFGWSVRFGTVTGTEWSTDGQTIGSIIFFLWFCCVWIGLVEGRLVM
ncbi:hypothetical protein CDAR_620341 [Caerostris darwini]|uniref:Uncharacterized protein n=1 Tax=Caerostris darwini TaxID=1538125 RepID=A0AAV4VLI3_9ARAC|nr:hypothetical protein CDAR_620341 [Caerostris darwini]